MDDGERAFEIDRLLGELSKATARKAVLLEEAQEFAARIHDIRAAFGNPFFYSHPENANESAANYSGTSSHEVVLPTLFALRDIDRELGMIRDRLRKFGISFE